MREIARATVAGETLWQKLKDPRAHIAIAENFVMDWSMLGKNLAGEFLIAGALSAFVPAEFWAALLLNGASPWLQVALNALVGPLVALISFVCSIGNVPVAAVLWALGISFGGVLSCLYADLIVLPPLDVYRRYYGWRMAAHIAVVFYVIVVLAGLIMDVAFTAAGLVPEPNPNIRAELTTFNFNHTSGSISPSARLPPISSGSTGNTDEPRTL